MDGRSKYIFVEMPMRVGGSGGGGEDILSILRAIPTTVLQ